MEIESWPKTFVFFLHNHNPNHHNHNQPSAIRPTKHKYGWSEITLKGGKLAHMCANLPPFIYVRPTGIQKQALLVHC